MQEYLSEAVVLETMPNGDLDLHVCFFSKKFGKITAKVKSARKITSRLAGHLQPGNMVWVRLVEKNGLQVADALKSGRIETNLRDLLLLNQLLADFQPDPKLWKIVKDEELDWRRVLSILGWDPAMARCWQCGGKPEYFRVISQDFVCRRCLALPPAADDFIPLIDG